MNLFSVGTVRDGEKWPKRDNRRAPQKRDLIIFDVFSPYTVEKMRRGRDQLLALSESTPKEKAFVSYGGLQLNRLLLRKGAKYYSMAISRYLNEKVCSHLMDALAASKDWKTATASLKPELKLKKSEEWTDLSGLLTARERVAALELRVADGALSSYDEVLHELQSMYDAYRADEWQYIYETFAKEYSVHLESITKEQAIAAVEEWQTAATSLHSMIIEDSKREFGSSAKIGYGLYESDEDRKQDFLVVRGSSETNSVVQKLVKEGGDIQQRYHQIKDRIPTT